jgi:hypothetical protein
MNCVRFVRVFTGEHCWVQDACNITLILLLDASSRGRHQRCRASEQCKWLALSLPYTLMPLDNTQGACSFQRVTRSLLTVASLSRYARPFSESANFCGALLECAIGPRASRRVHEACYSSMSCGHCSHLGQVLDFMGVNVAWARCL